MADALLDASGLKCPLPVLKAKRSMKPLFAGDVLEVRATDPGAVADFQHFCEVSGYTLLESRADAGVFVFRIRK
ncbi:MAG: sulfurtransferase TusA family protein [Alphaproteobacteria bacterium]|nr:sulfurtransferase TusA family protein [Alphaproteobacteria bacterium]